MLIKTFKTMLKEPLVEFSWGRTCEEFLRSTLPLLMGRSENDVIKRLK